MKKKYWLLLSAVLCVIVAIVCFLCAFPFKPSTQDPALGPTVATTQMTMPTVPTVPTVSSTDEVETPYVSPVDFQKLWDINPDIYAWITVPGTNINYPVVQSATDDGFYVDHDSDKNYSINGAIFSEHVYNKTDFSDAVTVLYGHNMKSGAMFGELQTYYWSEDFLRENDEIIIYLPDREIHFEMFAALPYSRMHLLHYYQTEKKRAFDLLIDDIYSTRKISAILIEERRPEFGDQVVVLSTCLSGDNRYRYLVMGVCKESS